MWRLTYIFVKCTVKFYSRYQLHLLHTNTQTFGHKDVDRWDIQRTWTRVSWAGQTKGDKRHTQNWKSYRFGIHTLILTHVSDTKALFVGAVIRRPSEEQLVTCGGDVEGHAEIATQHRQTLTVDIRTCRNKWMNK